MPRYGKRQATKAFELLLILCRKEEYKNCNDPEKIGKWRFTYNSFTGYYIEEIVNEGGAVKQPLGHEAYTAQEFCRMVGSIQTLILDGALRCSKKGL